MLAEGSRYLLRVARSGLRGAKQTILKLMNRICHLLLYSVLCGLSSVSRVGHRADLSPEGTEALPTVLRSHHLFSVVCHLSSVI